MKLLIILSLLAVSCKTENKEEYSSILFFQSVIRKANVGYRYTVKQRINDKLSEVNGFYLGELSSNKQRIKIVYSTSYYGNTRQANSALLLFDQDNNLTGFYSMGGVYRENPYLQKNIVIFPPEALAGCKHENSLNFTEGVPKEFFIECKNGIGDFYKLQKSDEWN